MTINSSKHVALHFYTQMTNYVNKIKYNNIKLR